MRELKTKLSGEFFAWSEGGKKRNLPKAVSRALIRKTRFFELDNVQDIWANYGELTNISIFPFSWWMYGVAHDLRRLIQRKGKFAPINPNYDPDKELKNLGDLTGTNLNFGIVYNVNLSDFDFMKRRGFEACSFLVSDQSCPADSEFSFHSYRPLRGVFIYKDVNEAREDNELRESKLAEVVGSPQNATFKLLFQTYPSRYELFVHGIKRIRGGEKERPIAPSPQKDYLPYDVTNPSGSFNPELLRV